MKRKLGGVKALRSLTLLLLTGCYPIERALEGDADPNSCDETFDDHTHVGAIDTATLEALQENPGARPQTVDFLVVWVSDAARREVRFEDGAFYDFHDQWYWFRLLNGVSACGSSANPVQGPRFATISEVDRALKDGPLPLDLVRTADGRLYSPSFYTLSLRAKPRVYASGTLYRYVGTADRYAFELPYVDPVTRGDLRSVHATIEAALPTGTRLFWRPISPAQGQLATTLQEDSEEPLRDRVLRVGEEP